jgi:hypothetical protein
MYHRFKKPQMFVWTAPAIALVDEIITSSSHNSIGMQSTAVHGWAVGRSAHSAAPTLRSNATTSEWLL